MNAKFKTFAATAVVLLSTACAPDKKGETPASETKPTDSVSAEKPSGLAPVRVLQGGSYANYVYEVTPASDSSKTCLVVTSENTHWNNVPTGISISCAPKATDKSKSGDKPQAQRDAQPTILAGGNSNVVLQEIAQPNRTCVVGTTVSKQWNNVGAFVGMDCFPK